MGERRTESKKRSSYPDINGIWRELARCNSFPTDDVGKEECPVEVVPGTGGCEI